MRNGLPVLFFVLLSLSTNIVLADPSVSTDVTRQREQSGSAKTVRDKKLTIDKSTGGKVTSSDSRETAQEKSVDRKSAERHTAESSRRQDYSVQVDINSRLIQQFMLRYESGNAASGLAKSDSEEAALDDLEKIRAKAMDPNADPLVREIAANYLRSTQARHLSHGQALYRSLPPPPSAVEFMRGCKPFSRLQVDYPVVVPDRKGQGVDVVTAEAAAKVNAFYQTDRSFLADPRHPVIARYGKCRLAGHYWLTRAAELATSGAVASEREIDERVIEAFEVMDAAENLQREIMTKVDQTWGTVTCGTWLRQANQYNGQPAMQCGSVQVQGETLIVFGLPSLSKEAIDGKRYSITVASADSSSHSREQSLEHGSKTSTANKSSSSKERYAETKRDAQLSVSKQDESGSTDRTQRGSQSTISVNPKSGQ